MSNSKLRGYWKPDLNTRRQLRSGKAKLKALESEASKRDKGTLDKPVTHGHTGAVIV
jgi:hypothetical protein